MEKLSVCMDCGKHITDLEYIRYGGVCMACWQKNVAKRKAEKKRANKANFCVTFQVKPNNIGKTLGFGTRFFAITCDTKEQALEAANDVNSIDGVKYVYINSCSRTRHNNICIFDYGMTYDRCIDTVLCSDYYAYSINK